MSRLQGPGPDRNPIPMRHYRARDSRHGERARALVFADPRSAALMPLIERIAPSEATVLIHGETGTGKEVLAQHIHALSKRARQPMLAVNCGALSATLIEAELFGYDAGAFTGATFGKPGWFEAANGATLFLDEIGELPVNLQAKLLRVLQEREVARLGSRRPIALDVRLIAATNQDLRRAVREGRFREDLYYRLRVVDIELPPLRERPGDILPLARHFLHKHGGSHGEEPPELSPEARELLLAHGWHGNIRELENVIQRALLIGGGGPIAPPDLQLTTPSPGESAPAPNAATPLPPSAAPLAADAKWNPQELRLILRQAFERQEREVLDTLIDVAVVEAWERAKGNQAETARHLGVTRNVARTYLRNAGLMLRKAARVVRPR